MYYQHFKKKLENPQLHEQQWFELHSPKLRPSLRLCVVPRGPENNT